MNKFLDRFWKKKLSEEEQELGDQPFLQLKTKVGILLQQCGWDLDEEMLQELRSWMRQKYPEFDIENVAETSSKNLSSLKFHRVHGKNIEILQGGTVAKTIQGYSRFIVFTD
ncbi:unnamed protein product, partial [Allacma fusca]